MLALTTAGCTDPSLRVVVEHPSSQQALAALVTRVEITVYAGEEITCDAIAFRKLSDEQLLALERSKGEGSLTAIPRLGHKAVVARGYGAPSVAAPGVERLVLAGCTEVDEIDAQERVVITTEPVATAATDGTLVTSGRGEVEIAVIAVDARQRGIDGKQVTWTTYGPATANANDVLEPATPIMLANGEGLFAPAPPTMVGPYAVQVRVKWSTSLPPPVTSTMVNLPVQRALGLPDPSFLNSCTIYERGGEPTLACLEKDSPTARFVRSYRLGATQLVPVAVPPPASVPNAVGVFGVGPGVVVVNADGTYQGVFGIPLSGTVCQGSCASAVLGDVLGFAGCSRTTQTAGLFASYREGLTQRLVATPLGGGAKRAFVAPTDGTVSLSAIGCVTDLETSSAPQIAATVNTTTLNQLYLFSSDTPIERRRERRLAGTGFAPSGGEARLLTTEVDATGFVIVESVLSKPGASYRLFERRRSSAVAPPRHYISGAFDADGETDLAWDIIEDLGLPTRAVQVLLGARPGRPPLSGRFPIPDNDDLLAADLDGDGVAEIIGYSNNSVSVQRLGSLVK
ncbi:MAG: hypothetical protein IPI49_20945 [Myxococcales bacterium]|nr:hypothetical protein [Myxococcales bacterium]